MAKVCTVLLFFLLIPPSASFAQQWYISDAAGIAYQGTSRSLALKEEYALMVETLAPDALEEELKKRLQYGDRIERQVLLKQGEEYFNRIQVYTAQGIKRIQQIRYTDGRLLLEEYDEALRLTEEYRSEGDEEGIRTVYNYDRLTLISMEVFSGELALYRDIFRYYRDGNLRKVERVLAKDTESGTSYVGVEAASVRFTPEMKRGAMDGILGPGAALETLTQVQEGAEASLELTYETDSRGRIIREQHLDSSGTVVLEILNTWEGNRLQRVLRISGEERYTTEYTYDASEKRISEMNYRGDQLERKVIWDGEGELEELYVEGIPVLRARWKDDQKLSEERLNPSWMDIPQ